MWQLLKPANARSQADEGRGWEPAQRLQPLTDQRVWRREGRGDRWWAGGQRVSPLVIQRGEDAGCPQGRAPRKVGHGVRSVPDAQPEREAALSGGRHLALRDRRQPWGLGACLGGQRAGGSPQSQAAPPSAHDPVRDAQLPVCGPSGLCDGAAEHQVRLRAAKGSGGAYVAGREAAGTRVQPGSTLLGAAGSRALPDNSRSAECAPSVGTRNECPPFPGSGCRSPSCPSRRPLPPARPSLTARDYNTHQPQTPRRAGRDAPGAPEQAGPPRRPPGGPRPLSRAPSRR